MSGFYTEGLATIRLGLAHDWRAPFYLQRFSMHKRLLEPLQRASELSTAGRTRAGRRMIRPPRRRARRGRGLVGHCGRRGLAHRQRLATSSIVLVGFSPLWASRRYSSSRSLIAGTEPSRARTPSASSNLLPGGPRRQFARVDQRAEVADRGPRADSLLPLLASPTLAVGLRAHALSVDVDVDTAGPGARRRLPDSALALSRGGKRPAP